MVTIPKPINLLPKEVTARLTLRYYLGIAAALLFLVALAVGGGAGLLIPSYFLAKTGAESSARYLTALEDTLGIKEKGGAASTMAALKERVAILSTYAEYTTMTAPILAALERALPDDVSIRKVALDTEVAGKADVAVSGVASSRGALLVFIDALKEDTSFSGVSVPVTQLAGEADLDFSLTFSFSQP